MATLAENDVNTFHMALPKAYLMVESNPLDAFSAFAYQRQFVHAADTAKGAEFKARIQSELDRAGSALSPEQIINRAEFEGCVGCHALGGTNFGGGVVTNAGFAGLPMIDETNLADGTRFRLAPAETTSPTAKPGRKRASPSTR